MAAFSIKQARVVCGPILCIPFSFAGPNCEELVLRVSVCRAGAKAPGVASRQAPRVALLPVGSEHWLCGPAVGRCRQ